MTRVTVEMAFGSSLADVVSTGGTWTDITQYADIVSNGISITHGAENENAQIQASTLTLVLDNSDGRFTPTLASSPYYPNVIDGVAVRVNVATVDPKNYVRNPSFEGDSLETWDWATGVNVSTVATPVQSGTRAARVDWNASASDYLQTTVYGLTVGAAYTASAYVRVPTGDVAVRVRMGGTDSSASAVNDAYTRLTVTFTATASVMTLQVIPSTTPAAGDLVYVDAVQVEAGAAATAFDATAAQLHSRFFGLVNQWPVQWEGLYATVTVTATDVFAVLSRAEEQMRPMLVQETLARGPDAYYPMDEDSGSTSAGDEAAVGGPLSLATVQAGSGGTLAFGEGTAPLGMSGCPLFTPASASAGKYLQASLGSAFTGSSFTEQLLAEAWFATSTVGRTIFSIASADNGYYVSFYLASGTGYLTVDSKAGSSVATTTAGAVTLADGALHHVIFDAEAQELYVDGASIGSFGGILAVQDLATLTVGASPTGTTLWSGSISNVALYLDTTMSATNLASHYTCGTTGFSGETATQRAFRLVTYLGLNYADTGTFSTGIAEQAALGSTCLDHLQAVEATESGKLYANRDSPGVTLQGRSVRYNPTSALTIVYADFEPGDFELAYDTQKLVNTVLVSRPGGATQRLVDAASKAARGPVGKTIDTLCTTDLVTTDLANWTLARYAAPHPELRGVHIEAYSMGTATYRTLMAADISTVFTVTTLPAEAPASSMSVTVEGYTETIKHNQHDLTFHTSTTVTDTVWVLDDTTYSVLGTTTKLAF